jgi:phage tail-like protein
MADPAIGHRFLCCVDGVQLGVFTKVDGLGAHYDIVTVKEGGENTHVHHLPGRLEYDNLKLTRPVDESSGALARWFTEFQLVLLRGGRLHPKTASISAYGSGDAVVATWAFLGVFPVRYTGPSFQAGTGSVLTETLELAHQGFWTADAAAAGPAPVFASLTAHASAALSFSGVLGGLG